MAWRSRWPKRPFTSSILNPGPVCKAGRLAFSGAKSHLKAYTRRKRKETLDEIMKPGRTINNTLAKQLPATLVQPPVWRRKPGCNDTV